MNLSPEVNHAVKNASDSKYFITANYDRQLKKRRDWSLNLWSKEIIIYGEFLIL